MIMEFIGRIIKAKRREKNLTQAQLGEKIGACYVSICNLEKGRNVSTYLLRDACKELGIELIVVGK